MKTALLLLAILGFESAAFAKPASEKVSCEEVESILADKPASFVDGPCTASYPAFCGFQVEIEGVSYYYKYIRGSAASFCSRQKVSE